MSGMSDPGVDILSGGPGGDGKDGKGGKGGKRGFPNLMEMPGLSGKSVTNLTIGALLAQEMMDRGSKMSEPSAGNQLDQAEAQEKRQKAAEDLKKRSAVGKVTQREEIGVDTNTLTPKEINELNARVKDGTNTNIDKDGKVVRPPAPAPRIGLNIDPVPNTSAKKLKADTTTQIDMKVLSDVLGSDAVAPNVSRMANIRPHITYSDDPNSQAIEQNNANDKMKNAGKAEAKALLAEKQKEKERLERLKAAEKIDPKALEWAKKRYKDPNLSDPGYLSQEKNKSILEWLQQEKNQDYIKRNPNYNLDSKVAPEKKSEVNLNQQKNDKTEMLNQVTDTKMALADSKKEQPIIITNNNTNTGGGSDPAPIGFGSASPRNTSTAINDYFRNNGRLHDAAYG
jgi:hypothetical protein